MSESVKAAGVIARAPSGRVLICERTDGAGWCWPGGHQKEGETPEKCAIREFWEETGYRLGAVKPFMRRVKDGVDFSTFIADVEEEFSVKLQHEHSAWMWADSKRLFDDAKGVTPSQSMPPGIELETEGTEEDD
jgi:8-oxo-dGTP pyrophosphatase MutT (NUDIX family)